MGGQKLKKKKTKFKIYSSPLTLSLSKFTDSLSLSLSLSLSGTPSSRPVSRPSPDSVSLSLRHSLFPAGRPSFTGFRLHRSAVLFHRIPSPPAVIFLSLQSRSFLPARTFLHRRGPFPQQKRAANL
jgi:hypothetical protein